MFGKTMRNVHIVNVISSVQSRSHVQLFATSRTVAHQASLSIPSSQSLLKLMSIESMMPSNHLILCCPPFSSCLQCFLASWEWIIVTLVKTSSIKFITTGFELYCYLFLVWKLRHSLLSAELKLEAELLDFEATNIS